MLCLPVLVVAVGIIASAGLKIGEAGNDQASWARLFAHRSLAAYVLVAIASVLLDRLTNRAEARIGQSLPHRVSRGIAVSVPMMLGRVRTAFLVSALASEAGFAVVLLALGSGGLEWLYLVAFVASCGFLAIGLRQAATRPTVAFDPMSLALDERLRSEDAYEATGPLLMLLLAFYPAALNSALVPGWLDPIWAGVTVTLMGLRLWGMKRGPWHSTHRRMTRTAAPIPNGGLR